MKLKGFVLYQSLLEAVMIAGVVITLLAAAVWFSTVSHRENVKLRCLEYNAYALEQLREAYYDSGDIGIFEYSETDGSYTTSVISADSVRNGESTIYRVVIETSYKNEPVKGTEVVAYVAGQ